MSSMSNVGNSQAYGKDDQKAENEQPERFHEGKPNAHKALDSKDERSIANKLAAEEHDEKKYEGEKGVEQRLLEKDATLPAKAHGNKPSRGAEIDQEIREEEEEELRRKGKLN